MSSTPIDLEAALDNPASVFAVPEDVVAHPGLSTEQKIDILRLWEYDVAEAQVATEEGMPGGNGSELLRRILLALGSLIGDAEVGNSAPTKQRAITRRRAGRG